MKISTKGRYAMRLMLQLALENTGENITIKTIAAKQNILLSRRLEAPVPCSLFYPKSVA